MKFRWLPEDSRLEEVPFRRVFQKVSRPVPEDAEIVTAYTDGQVTLRSNRDKKSYHEAADLSGFQGVQEGDFVVHGLDILRGSVGVSESTGAMSSVCSVCVPVLDADPRFFAYAMRAQAWSGVPRALAKGVREGGADFRRWETLAELPLPLPNLAEQRAIADYLDAETARIDALITKKQQLVHLLEARMTIEVETVVRRLGNEHGLAPLKHFAGPVTVGIVITPAKWYVEAGIPAVRGTNVSPGRIDMNDAVFLSDEGHRENAKSTLRAGDLVVVRTGQAGAAAVVPAGLDGANCIDLLIVRAASGVRPRFLEYVLNSDWTLKHIGEHSVGSIQAHFNVASLREVPVPTPPVEIQDDVVSALDRVALHHRAMISSLTRQLELLAEHRHALITAAVTGELDVPGAA